MTEPAALPPIALALESQVPAPEAWDMLTEPERVALWFTDASPLGPVGSTYRLDSMSSQSHVERSAARRASASSCSAASARSTSSPRCVGLTDSSAFRPRSAIASYAAR